MPGVDLIYYLAGGFLILMANMRTVIAMRMCHLMAGTLFTGYGVAAQVWPVAILNGILVLIQIKRLLTRTGTEAVQTA